jgi:hypothetical protein
MLNFAVEMNMPRPDATRLAFAKARVGPPANLCKAELRGALLID